jgi:transposase
MLTVPENVRIHLAAGATDMRKSFDTLAALTRSVIGQDPRSGHLFVFCNRGRDRLKILHWESSGYWLLAKRLEKGTFAWPDAQQTSVMLTATELAVLLGGLDVRDTRKRPWYGR